MKSAASPTSRSQSEPTRHGLIAKQRPILLDEECRGFFDGGPTPQACVREVVKGIRQLRRNIGTSR